MKAISLHQPYASFVALGHKHYETRTWQPPKALIGQLVAIHAAKKWGGWQKQLASFAAALVSGHDPCAEALALFRHADPPLGAVVCICRVVSVQRVEAIRDTVPLLEYTLGDYKDGRFAWELELVERLPQVIPAKGQQRIFNWERP